MMSNKSKSIKVLERVEAVACANWKDMTLDWPILPTFE